MLFPMDLVFVTREGCGLCEKAERALWTLGIPYVRRDVDQDPELFRLYTFRVPVLLLGDRVLLEGGFAERELLTLMENLPGPRPLGGKA
ncbi:MULTISPECIES: glutaredoxin family protein [Thermus]|uniref:NrdH-redoxin n=1 Tax=Thermus scotoductus TaxID=37636 RepID=A0A430RDW8_THESC|nr:MULTISPECIES: glutaredoxin family protein [Thermus]RTH05592.1 NrdH-redoxin [Thermus scotoductus]RTI11912.1 NrdH-redoxin [Thermus scotoductus]UZX15754.1 glutaredoxin family protein [Thermus sp. PS18]